MTFADVMLEMLMASLAVYAVVALVSGGLGALLCFWLVTDRREAGPGADVDDAWLERVLDEPVFATGVAKVGDR